LKMMIEAPDARTRALQNLIEGGRAEALVEKQMQGRLQDLLLSSAGSACLNSILHCAIVTFDVRRLLE